jgi:hypothetical protein
MQIIWGQIEFEPALPNGMHKRVLSSLRRAPGFHNAESLESAAKARTRNAHDPLYRSLRMPLSGKFTQMPIGFPPSKHVSSG